LKDRIEIPLSKKKIFLLLVGGVGLLICGIYITINPQSYIPNIFRINNPEIIQITGIMGILFFGAGVIFIFKKLFDKRIGLIIDSDGITDNTSGVSIGLIEWNDILEIRADEVMSTKFLLIYTVDPEKYIKKAKNKFQARLLRANYSMYKTPLSISSTALKFNFGELEKLIQSELARRKTLCNNI